jgi:hypothetical protein
MDSLQGYLLELSDRLDKQGKLACADAVDDLIKTASLQKLAQYVGVIGYVLKQNRAMGNCIRKKRAASKAPMQEVVLDCLKEYQDGQDYHDTEWTSKYAQVIQQEPQKFDVAHLFFLSTVGENDNINDHIDKVEKVAVMLEENGIQEEVFSSMLGHIGTLSNILSKDSATHANFKLAASPRGWWSRFWNPSGVSFNPRSWSRSVRERGQDLDAIQELDAILDNLTSVTRITQQIKTRIHRLQAESTGYTAGSGKELDWTRQPAQEDIDVIQTLTRKIGELQPEDWNRSLLALQQLNHLLENTPVHNEYNQQIFSRAKKAIAPIFASMETVYESISSIQEDMQSLRTRAPILGRASGLTDEGRRNPFGQVSPAEEYAVLQEVLERLYENPMNSKAQWYAQKAHGRLWDKLRYIERGSDTGMESWLQTPTMPNDYGDTYEDETRETPETSGTPVAEESVDNEGVERLYNEIDTEAVDRVLADPNTYSSILYLLGMLSDALQGNARQVISEFREALKQWKEVGRSENNDESNPGDHVDSLLNDLTAESSKFGLDKSVIQVSDLVKAADLIDEIDENVADILDEFIK